MKRLTLYILTVTLALVLLAQAAAGYDIMLPKGAKLKVKFDPSISIDSGNLEKGAIVKIFLAEDYVKHDVTLLKEGTEGTAEVTEVEKASRPGDPGMIKVTFVDLTPKGGCSLKGGDKVLLTDFVENKGKSRKFISWVFILGLFIKGGQGEIDTSAVYEAEVADNALFACGN